MLQGLKERARTVRNQIGVLYAGFNHERTPWVSKLILFLVVAYALSPIDLIPDFVPVLGYLDNVILLPLGIVIALKFIPEDVLEECREQAEKNPASCLSTIGVALVIGIWMVAGLITVRLLLSWLGWQE